MKKFLSLVLATLLCLSCFCFAEADADKALAEKIADYEARIGTFEEEIHVSCLAPYKTGWDHSIFDKVIKDNLNIVFDYIELSDTDLDQQLDLLFHAGDFPEVLYSINTGNYISTLQSWGEAGYVLPINEYAEAMPNYMELLGETEWENIKTFYGDYNGNVYQFCSRNYRSASRAWIYRMDEIEALGLEEPTTTDEFYVLLAAFKEKYPDSIPLLNRWGISYVYDAFCSAFHTKSDFWYNIYTEELEYGPASNEFRDMLIYVNKLYSEGLIDQEFLTTSDDQHKEYTANGKNVAEFTYSTRAAWANNLLPETATKGWVWSGNYITAYDDKYDEGISLHDSGYFPIGQVWTAALTDEEKILRLAAWLDYSATEEGSEISVYGVEGKTFYRDENGYARSNKDQPDSYLANDNVFTGPSYLTRYAYGWLIDNGKLTDLDFSEAIVGKEYYRSVAYSYTADQQSRMTTLKTQLDDTRDEWASKFIMGTDGADASDDAQWNAFIKALDEAGLEEALEINSETAIIGA